MQKLFPHPLSLLSHSSKASLSASTPRCVAPVLEGKVVEEVHDVLDPRVSPVQWSDLSLPRVAEDARGLYRLLGVDSLPVVLAGEERERTLRWRRRLRKHELEQLLFLLIEQPIYAVDHVAPIRMQVYRVRLRY